MSTTIEELTGQMETLEKQVTENDAARRSISSALHKEKDDDLKLEMQGQLDRLGEKDVKLAAQYKVMADSRRELKQHEEVGGKAKESLHKNAPGVPDLLQQLTDIEVAMNSAAAQSNMTEYLSLKKQRQQFIREHGRTNLDVVVDSGEAFATTNQRQRVAESAILAKNPNADLVVRMQAAADAGDLNLYRQLRAERMAAG